jgi:hypothetical protein
VEPMTTKPKTRKTRLWTVGERMGSVELAEATPGQSALKIRMSRLKFGALRYGFGDTAIGAGIDRPGRTRGRFVEDGLASRARALRFCTQEQAAVSSAAKKGQP